MMNNKNVIESATGDHNRERVPCNHRNKPNLDRSGSLPYMTKIYRYILAPV